MCCLLRLGPRFPGAAVLFVSLAMSQMAPYALHSALLLTRALWALVVRYVGNRVPFHTQSVCLSVCLSVSQSVHPLLPLLTNQAYLLTTCQDRTFHTLHLSPLE